MDQIEGFKQYLSVAEEDRLEYLNPPKKTPELFEKFLPYAIALDVRTVGPRNSPACWPRRVSARRWRPGTPAMIDGTHSVTSFADRLGDDLSSTISAAATPPGSSGGGSSSGSGGGSSGGGSSGGGGGGGGGSGW